jgi:hypothetical protein
MFYEEQMMVAVTERPRKRKSRYFLAASCIALIITFIGFFKTFILPSARGTFIAPAVIYVHGGLLFLWTILLVTQSMLIQMRKVKLHRLLGFLSLGLVPCVAISTMAAGVYVLKRDLALGGGQIAVSSLVGTFTAPLIFAALVTVAIVYRRRPELHKRLMLLAMIAIIWPAFFRFRHYFPSVAHPEFVFGFVLPQSMILLAMLWEKLTLGRVHAVYLTVGLALVAENFAEYYLFDSSGWRVLANWLAGFFL